MTAFDWNWREIEESKKDRPQYSEESIRAFFGNPSFIKKVIFFNRANELRVFFTGGCGEWLYRSKVFIDKFSQLYVKNPGLLFSIAYEYKGQTIVMVYDRELDKWWQC